MQPGGECSRFRQCQLGVLTRRQRAEQETGGATLQQLSSVPRLQTEIAEAEEGGNSSVSGLHSSHTGGGTVSGLKDEPGVESGCSPLQPKCLTFGGTAEKVSSSCQARRQ